LNIVSEKERYVLAQDKVASQAQEKDVKLDVKPIVFQNIDAATGKPAELKDVTTLTPMEAEKKKLENNQKMIET
jgi:hypothetical protein